VAASPFLSNHGFRSRSFTKSFNAAAISSLECAFFNLAISATAKTSHRSFSGFPEWPRTQFHATTCFPASISKACHRSTLRTGFKPFFQFLPFHALHQIVRPFRNYSESLKNCTPHRSFNFRNPPTPPRNSLRLLVLPNAPPLISARFAPYNKTAAQPPTPG